MGYRSPRPRVMSVPEMKVWINICIQILTGLFSYLNGIAIPWRVSILVHQTCSKRASTPGCDFYGRPTEAPFFHIPVGARRKIIGLLLGSNSLHYASQGMRIAFPTFDTAEKPFYSLLLAQRQRNSSATSQSPILS